MKGKLAVILGGIFFVFGVITLPHYGVNWDAINHLPRGQAYLHYFLTGKKDFSDLPKFEMYWQAGDTLLYKPDSFDIARVSLYQNAGVDFLYFMEKDGGGHPPLSDILSSLFNYILFQKLGMVNDIDAYRIYGVFLASVLVGLIYFWTKKVYGSFAGLVAAAALSTYPLFWAESHFNTEKDIPETVYWSLLLFAVWKGVVEKKRKWLIAAGVFFGLALGTKFNALFSVFVILPWLLFIWGKKYGFRRKWIIWVVKWGTLAVLVGIGLFFVGWPYLWLDPIGRVGTVFSFYKNIGTTSGYDPRFLGPMGTNTYPIMWIIYTTPPVTLALFGVGLFALGKKIFVRKDSNSVLFLCWLLVPIARATWPGATTYGGVRQLMEYIPAMAIIAGLGAAWVRDKVRVSTLVIIFLVTVPISMRLYEIHPNENVYFNFLVGGLSGAKQKDIPHWGVNFGAAYRQGAEWLNENVEKDGKVVYNFELLPNIPRIWLRRDIQLFNTYRSGYLMEGEYSITLVSRGSVERSYYDMYLEKFIEPVYQVKVDGVSILKIWKNDRDHLKVGYEEKLDTGVDYEVLPSGLRFDLGEIRSLSRLELKYDERGCEKLLVGYTSISKDGENWVRLPGVLPDDWRISAMGEQPKGGDFIEPFTGQETRYIDFNLLPKDTCMKNVVSYKFYYFE